MTAVLKDSPTPSDVHVSTASNGKKRAKLYAEIARRNLAKRYASVKELPAAVKAKLKGDPNRLRQWMHVFNSALDSHGDESRAFAGAWSAVQKDEGSFRRFVKAESVVPELGIVLGWAIVCKEDGRDYWDVQRNHIPEDAMFEAAADFMEHSRVGNEMHAGPDKGTYVFAFPLTTEIAKAMGIVTKKTGLMIGYKPPPDVLAKFACGDYTGFSIEGHHIDLEDLT